MRLSMNDPITPLHLRALVFLDGEKQESAIVADEEAGYILRYAEDQSQAVSELLTEEVYGDVKIVDPEKDK